MTSQSVFALYIVLRSQPSQRSVYHSEHQLINLEMTHRLMLGCGWCFLHVQQVLGGQRSTLLEYLRIVRIRWEASRQKMRHAEQKNYWTVVVITDTIESNLYHPLHLWIRGKCLPRGDYLLHAVRSMVVVQYLGSSHFWKQIGLITLLVQPERVSLISAKQDKFQPFTGEIIRDC